MPADHGVAARTRRDTGVWGGGCRNEIKHESFDQIRKDPRVSCVVGDLCEKAVVQAWLDPEGCTHVVTIHLAAVLSGYAEENFDLGMKARISRTPAAHVARGRAGWQRRQWAYVGSVRR